MERVQFQQERMLPELKDLVLKGLFSEVEVKQVMKKRTEFETALVRRIARKSDYLRYAAYEMDLENLRKKRAERMKKTSSLPSVSDYALVQRQFHIFERAVKKFKNDVGMWIQYIQVADKMGARALVGKITARALQLHPTVPSLYILAASHELDSLSTSAARMLLQRGIRLNPDDVQLWTEYVKMELGFIEGLRRRWNVLGLDMESNPSAQKSKQKEKPESESPEVVDSLYAVEETDTDAGRRQIMDGAIVKSVMTNAVEGLCKIELFKALNDLILNYPLPKPLRDGLLDHLYALLREHMLDDPQAVALLAARFVPSGTVGVRFVEGLKNANEEFMQAVRRSSARDDMCCGYAQFVSEWCQRDIDDSLVRDRHADQSLGNEYSQWTQLVSTRVRKLASSDPEAILRTGPKDACKGKCQSGWTAQLEAEWRFGSHEEAEAWVVARGKMKDSGNVDMGRRE